MVCFRRRRRRELTPRFFFPEKYMLVPVSYLQCVYANSNWVIDAVLANGEKTLLLETTTNSSAYIDRDAM